NANKRTALASLIIFLELNSYTWTMDVYAEEDFIVGIVTGEYTLEEITAIIKKQSCVLQRELQMKKTLSFSPESFPYHQFLYYCSNCSTPCGTWLACFATMSFDHRIDYSFTLFVSIRGWALRMIMIYHPTNLIAIAVALGSAF